MFCTFCGAKIEDGSKYCPTCGAQQEIAEEIKQQENVQPVSTVSPVFQGSDLPKMQCSPKSRLTALMLAIFLGDLGVNNFYVGNKGKGFAKLLIAIFGIVLEEIGLFGDSAGALFFAVLLLLAVAIWKIVDIVKVAKGEEIDGKGLPVTDWQND